MNLKIFIYLFILLLGNFHTHAREEFNVLSNGKIISSKDWIESADDYRERINRQIKPLIVYIGNSVNVTPCEVNVRLEVDGKINHIEITQMSSEIKWCEAVINALKRSEYLPKTKEGKTPNIVNIKFNP